MLNVQSRGSQPAAAAERDARLDSVFIAGDIAQHLRALCDV